MIIPDTRQVLNLITLFITGNQPCFPGLLTDRSFHNNKMKELTGNIQMFIPSLLALAPLIAAILCAILALYAFRLKPGIGRIRSTLLFIALTCYALGAVFELSNTDFAGAAIWIKIEYIGIALAPPCWLALVLAYAGYEKKFSRPLLSGLFVVPVITIAIVFSPLMIPLLYQSAFMHLSGPFPVLRIIPGPWYWVNTGYNIVMMAVGTGILILMFLRSGSFFRSQIVLMLVGSLAPFVALILNITGLRPIPDLDITPFALVVTGFTILPAISRYQFMDIIPIAQSTVLKDMPVGVMVLDSRMRVREINPAAEQILTLTSGTAIGRNADELIPAWAEITGHLTGPGSQYELPLTYGNVSEVYLVSRIPLEEVAGSPTGSVILFSSITARIRAEEQERRRTSQLMTLLDSLPGYAYYKDTAGTYITANMGFCELFQIEGPIEGRNDRGVLPDPLADQVRVLEQSILTGERESAEFEGEIHAKGGTVIISGKIVPFRVESGDIAGVIGLGYDITERKAEEARIIEYSGIIETRNRELLHLHDQLEQVNRDLDTQVHERTREVEALLIQKDHFIEQLGHDLRTPLIPLVGLMPFLIEQEKDDDIVRLLTQMKISVDVMQNTVEQVIQLARLNSMYSITDRVKYDLSRLIGSVVAELAEEAGDKGVSVSLEVASGLYVLLSPVHAQVIFRHVLSNAIRYNLPAGRVTITGEADSDAIVIAVSDTGIGIDESDITRIFDEFYRTDRSRQSLEAKGLGLTIVRRMVTLNGGTIWAESGGSSKGSTFFIRLPLAE